MSDSPPKTASGPGSSDAGESPKESSVADATPAPKIEPAAALDEAAKAMDAAAPKTDAASPATPKADAIASTPPTTTSAAPPAASPPINIAPLPATTSGMHLQYVAPGVQRQSWMASNGRLLGAAVMIGTLFAVLYMMHGGPQADVGDLPGANATETTTKPTTNPQLNNQTATGQYYPPQNPTTIPTPQADFTVNAGAIGDTTAPLPKHDAGKNKGGYAQEQADLEAARAMLDKDPNKALALVDQHDVDYPRGILDPEARVIRVEAFAKKGDDAKALALGNEFLEDYPHSPGAGRVQALVESLKNKQGGPPPDPNHP